MKKIIKYLVLLILLTGIAYTGFISYKGYVLYKDTMTSVNIEEVIDEIRSRENYTSIDDMPSTFIDAVVAVEDHRFLEHSGFDIIAFSRAVLRNIKESEYAAGGSTITQQLSKNLFFSFDKKMERKVAELIVAFKLEDLYEKDELLEVYVNIIYFGDGFEGVTDAAVGYYNKQPHEMSGGESVLLAGLPQAPSAYALFEHFDMAVKRSESVLDAMELYKYITKREKETLKMEIEQIKIQVN